MHTSKALQGFFANGRRGVAGAVLLCFAWFVLGAAIGGRPVIVDPQWNWQALEALGTLAAVAVAIYLPWRIHRNDQLRADARDRIAGRSLALRLIADVADWNFRLDAASGIGPLERVLELFPSVIEPPESLTKEMENLAVLGRAAEPLQQAIYDSGVIEKHKLSINRVCKNEGSDEEVAEVEALQNNWMRLRTSVVSASARLEGLFG